MLILSALVFLQAPHLHFVGDDWEFVAPYIDRTFADDLRIIVGRRYRLGEELYFASLIWLFGPSRLVFNLLGLFWHGLSCLLFAEVVARAWPRFQVQALLAAWVAFLLPFANTLPFYAYLSVIQLALALQWGGLLALMFWAERQFRIVWLACFGLLSFASFATYESGTLFLLLIPVLLVSSLSSRGQILRLADIRQPFISLAVACALVLLAMLLLRYGFNFVDKGVEATEARPPIQNIWNALVWYLSEPLRGLPSDLFPIIGLCLALVVGGLWVWRSEAAPAEALPGILLLGVALILLGLVPYWLAAKDFVGAWNERARYFSSAAYGIALITALFPGFAPGRWLRAGLYLALSLLMGFWAASWLARAQDWNLASQAHCALFKSLLDAVPSVKEGTVFVVKDLRHNLGVAPVFMGSDSLLALFQKIYREPEHSMPVNAFHIPKNPGEMVVGEAGIFSPLSQIHLGREIQFDRLLLVRRDQERLLLVERLTKADGVVGIAWNNASEVSSNIGRIEAAKPSQREWQQRLLRQGGGCVE